MVFHSEVACSRVKRMTNIPLYNLDSPKHIANGTIHVRLVSGLFQRLRYIVSAPLVTLFVVMAWVQCDGKQAIQFSLAEHQLRVFAWSLSWNDLPLLAGLLIVAALILFVMAMTIGRAWCGFACPQSIWSWMFIRIEDFTEGNSRKRARKQPLTFNRIIRKLTKHGLWIIVSAVTAFSFSAYFFPSRELLHGLLTFTLPVDVAGWLLIMLGLTYLNAGYVREKICLHACPYARFQSVMFDRDTYTVSYDVERGEPRNKSKALGIKGDCVDCTLCVQVCPVGIDIRNGLQAACIDCGACIDACDSVMRHLGKPKGLIRFASDNILTASKARFWRPRLFAYSAVTAVCIVIITIGFANKTDLLFNVQRDRNELYVLQADDRLCNSYQLKIESFVHDLDSVEITVNGLNQATVEGATNLSALSDNAQWQLIKVCTKEDLPYWTKINFVATSGEKSWRQISTFIAPST